MRLVLMLVLSQWTLISACKSRSTALAEVQSSGACRAVVVNGAVSQEAVMANARNPECATAFLPLPLVKQTKGFTCGAASLQSLLAYWGDFYTEGVLQRILKSHKENGTSFQRIRKFVLGLNTPAREKFDAISGFDENVDLNELRVVLADRDVLDLIRRKSAASADFKKVMTGIGKLKDSDFDIDQLAVASAGLSLADASGEARDSGPGKGVLRTQRADSREGMYDTELYMTQVPYKGDGTLPVGCAAFDEAALARQTTAQNAMTMAQLEKFVQQGTPVIALTQAWTYDSDANYNLESYAKGWDSGHYVVVIGMDPVNVYLMDPFTMGHYAFVPRTEFDQRWHDYDGALNAQYLRCPGGMELHHFGLAIRRNTQTPHIPDQITKMY